MGARHRCACGQRRSLGAPLLDIVPPEPNAEEKKRGLTVTSPEVRNRIVRAGLAAAANPSLPRFSRGAWKIALSPEIWKTI